MTPPIRQSAVAAGIIAGGIIVAAFLVGGRFDVRLDGGKLVRLDRLTGQILLYDCPKDEFGNVTCGKVLDTGSRLGKSEASVGISTMNVEETLTIEGNTTTPHNEE